MLLEGKRNFNIRSPTKNIAKIVKECSIAIGAGGMSCWERVALGLPSLVISVSLDQSPICNQLHRLGLINYLGEAEKVTQRVIRHEFVETVHNLPLFRKALEESNLCDGMGATRVAKIIMGCT